MANNHNPSTHINSLSKTVIEQLTGVTSDGDAKTQIVDGSDNVIGSTSNALDVNVKSDGAGLALDDTLTDGSQKTQVVGGGGTNIDFATDAKLDTIISDLSDLEDDVETVNTNLGTIETDIEAVKTAVDEIKAEQFPESIYILAGVAVSDTDTYLGFYALEADTAITSITGVDTNLVKGDNDFSEVTFQPGTFVRVPGGFTTMTLSAGAMVLVIDNS